MLHADFLQLLELSAKERPGDPVFYCPENDYEPITFSQLRTRSLRLVRALDEQGIRRGGSCAIDLENTPAFIYMLIAAAYGGFSLIALNTRLTQEEKRERARELYRYFHCDSIPRLDEATIESLLAEQAQAADVAAADPTSATAKYGNKFEGDVNLLARTAQRGLASADDRATAVVMFTSGTQGRPKAANLTWGNLLGAAAAANARLCKQETGCWQIVLPLYHVGGLSIVLRSILNRSTFILYRNFDAYTTLRDVRHFEVSHISVVDKILQDLLVYQNQAEKQNLAPELGKLNQYSCILLGGAAPNSETLKRANKAGASVFVSYGLTETSSCAAAELAGKKFDGFVSPLPGYSFTVLNPDTDGVGRLAVKGPGVFDGYLNTQASFTPDGYFITGDSARSVNHRIQVAERSEDMFISGGENIYPQEIRDKLCSVPGVSDAYVFGVEDETWGRRPVAFIEKEKAEQASDELDDGSTTDAVDSTSSSAPTGASDCTGSSTPEHPADNFAFAETVRTSLSTRLSRIYTPDHLLVLDTMPRNAVGKIDRKACQKLWNERIQVQRVELWRALLPMKHSIRTAKTTMKDREVLLLRATSANGHTGLGECAAFSTNWYLPETISSCENYLENELLPALIDQPFLNPIEAANYIAQVPGASQHPLACATIETALWDIYGKATKRSIRTLIGGRAQVSEKGAIRHIPKGCVPGGAVVGVGSAKDVVATVRALVEQGYARVKLKVQPGRDVKIVAAVRDAFPDLVIALDANQSYKDTQVSRLRQMDEYDIAFIEEPLRPDWHPRVGPQDIFARLARVQDELSAQVCLDESWHTQEQLRDALVQHPELRCVSMKIAKFGGLYAALEFYRWARERGIQMVVGGMFDTGISKRLHAAFCTLPGIQLPGDISSSSRYFSVDVCKPPFELDEDAFLQVNPDEYPYGLGCTLDGAALERILIRQ